MLFSIFPNVRRLLWSLPLCASFALASVPADSSLATDAAANAQIATADTLMPLVDHIIDYGRTFLGKRYRSKADNGTILDCSGYVSTIYGRYDIRLPRSSPSIAQVVDSIPLSEVRKGDLLFFKGRRVRSKKVGHVSMVVDVRGNEIIMMHSSSRGILVENTELPYYQKRFLFAGRLSKVAMDSLVLAPIQLAQGPAADSSVASDAAPALNAAASATTPSPTTPNQTSRSTSSPQAPRDTVPHPDTTGWHSIIGVGDMMLGTWFPSPSYLPPKDGREILSPVKAILADADVTFGNLEGSLFSGEGTVKKCDKPENCYAFKSPVHYSDYLVEAGIDVVSIANNHVGDFGDEGRKSTAAVLSDKGIAFAGLVNYPYTVFERNGVKYGFCAFSPNSGTMSITDLEGAQALVRKLDSLSDIVIVSFHGGAEGAKYRNITRKDEIHLGENRGNPYAFARAVIDAGADVVFGHGPHVTRAIDLYKGRFIAYSLGNFATYGRFNLKGPTGLAPIVKVSVDGTGKFQKAFIVSTRQVGEGGPILDSRNAVLKEIQELTASDIPESPLRIQDDGWVLPKVADF